MNDRAQTLIIRFVLLFPLFTLGILGLYRLFLPLLAPGAGSVPRLLVDAIVPACTIGLSTSAALVFAAFSHGARERKEDLAPIRIAFGWIIFFALLLMAFASFGTPAIHKHLAISDNMPARPRPAPSDPPLNSLKDGIRHYYDAKYEAAIDRIRTFLASAPGNSIATDYLASAQAALARQEQIKNTRVGDQTATFRRGYDNLLEGNYLLAIMEFERLLRFYPNHSLAKKHLEDARSRLKTEQSGSAGDLRAAGLKARLERTVARALSLYGAQDWKGCLTLMSEVLMLDPTHPTALRHASLAREKISARGFLDEELASLPWYPALANVVLRLTNGTTISARRFTREGSRIWLQDAWYIPPPGNTMLPRIFARQGKTVATNTLVLRNTLTVRTLTNGRIISTPGTSGSLSLYFEPDRLETAALLYGQRLDITPFAILEHGPALISEGYPALVLWQKLARQITLPFLVFLLASVAAASGWRFQEQPSSRSGLILKILAVPPTGVIIWFCYGSLVRISDSLVFAAEAVGIHGWAAIPVIIVLFLLTTVLFLSRLLRK